MRELGSVVRIGLSGGESIARKPSLAIVLNVSTLLQNTGKVRVQQRSDIESMRTNSRILTVLVETNVATEAGLTLWGGVGTESIG